jgi:hypothetical protein
MAPEYIIHDTHQSRRFLIMQYFNETLEDYICKFQPGKKRDE